MGIKCTNVESYNSEYIPSTITVGRLNSNIFCLRYTLVLDKNTYIKQFTFELGNSNLYLLVNDLPNKPAELKASFDGLCSNNRFRCTITDNSSAYLTGNNLAYLNKQEILNLPSTQYATMSVSHVSTQQDNSVPGGKAYYYKMTGTISNCFLKGG